MPKTTSTERSRRSRAAEKLGMIYVTGYVRACDHAEVMARIVAAENEVSELAATADQ